MKPNRLAAMFDAHTFNQVSGRAGHGPLPTGMNGADHASVGIVRTDQRAVGGHLQDRNTGTVGHESIDEAHGGGTPVASAARISISKRDDLRAHDLFRARESLECEAEYITKFLAGGEGMLPVCSAMTRHVLRARGHGVNQARLPGEPFESQ